MRLKSDLWTHCAHDMHHHHHLIDDVSQAFRLPLGMISIRTILKRNKKKLGKIF